MAEAFCGSCWLNGALTGTVTPPALRRRTGRAGGRSSGASHAGARPGLVRHEATLLTPALIEEADFILTMTRLHKRRHPRHECPAPSKKLFRWQNLSAGRAMCEDPVGQGVDVYRQTAARLRELLEQAVEKLDFPGQGNSDDV